MLCTCQDTAPKVMNVHVHHSRPCSEKSDIDTSHTALHIKPTLWPLTTEKHAGKDRDLNSHVEDARNIDDNASTDSSETTIALGGWEADGHLSDLLPNSQADLNILTREIHSLWQCIDTREGQSVGGLDHIDCLEQVLWTLSLTTRTQPTSTPTPTEPYGEVVC